MLMLGWFFPAWESAKKWTCWVDTGSSATILHPGDGRDMGFPFDELRDEVIVTSVSGTQTYYAEPAVVSFYDGEGR